MLGKLTATTICSVKGCKKPICNKGTQLCWQHYCRHLKYGDVTHNERPRNRRCSVVGCTNPHKGQGYCKKHLDRFRQYGNPLVTKIVRQPGRVCSVPGCDNPHSAKGLCRIHYLRNYGRGGDIKERRRVAAGAPKQFMDNALLWKSDECLIWPYSRTDGYASISPHWKLGTGVCRYLCTRVYGPAPTERHHCAHSCGNGQKGCINPRHLRWATPEENMRDKRKHGTANRGERVHLSKLTVTQVREMRSLKGQWSAKVLAAHFGVKVSTVYSIFSGQSWAWLE